MAEQDRQEPGRLTSDDDLSVEELEEVAGGVSSADVNVTMCIQLPNLQNCGAGMALDPT